MADTIRCTEEGKSHYDQLRNLCNEMSDIEQGVRHLQKAMVVVSEANRLIDVAKAKEATD